jgi:ornithine cyclodeaminase
MEGVMAIILGDSDLEELPVMQLAIEAIEGALLARSAGGLVSPPRHNVSFAEKGDLIFTIGGMLDDASIAGFRVYDTFKGPRHEQITAVWSTETAELQGLIIGTRLGEIRTGAIGGIAIRYMSSPDARTVGVIGSGQQARAQLEAAALVRELTHVWVYSRSERNRYQFALEMGERLGIPVEPVGSPRCAVREADIVICATSSLTPVIKADWLKAGVHINTVGPKMVDEHELGLDVAAAAHLIATDSLEQVKAYKMPFFLEGTASAERLVDLAAIVSGKLTVREGPGQTTLFCSVGLAGTEVLVGARILDALKARAGAD